MTQKNSKWIRSTELRKKHAKQVVYVNEVNSVGCNKKAVQTIDRETAPLPRKGKVRREMEQALQIDARLSR